MCRSDISIGLNFYCPMESSNNSGGFHLYLFELAFINQFHSRMTSLFQQSFANDYFRNHFTISSKYFDMACYWKQEAYPGLISFEIVQWQLNWFIWDASSSSTALLNLLDWNVNEKEIKREKVHMKPPSVWKRLRKSCPFWMYPIFLETR